MSFKQQPQLEKEYINPTQYKMRLEFIQNRCRMLEELFEKDYEEERLSATTSLFYMQMVRSLDSCASALKSFKVLSK